MILVSLVCVVDVDVDGMALAINNIVEDLKHETC